MCACNLLKYKTENQKRMLHNTLYLQETEITYTWKGYGREVTSRIDADNAPPNSREHIRLSLTEL